MYNLHKFIQKYNVKVLFAKSPYFKLEIWQMSQKLQFLESTLFQ